MSKLHIICPVINCLHYTQRMVSSIKTEQPFKLTIIDNQSSDGTDRWCEGQGIDCIRNGMGVFTLQMMLGHSTLDMTRRYAGLITEDLIREHEKASPVDNLKLK